MAAPRRPAYRVTVVNPFFEPSPLPYALPPFEEITDEDFAPALDRGMADQLAEVEAIVANPDDPTFDNTLVPLELSGQLLERVKGVFFNKTMADATARTDELQTTYATRLAAHEDTIKLNSALYERIKTVHDAREVLGPEERYLVERHLTELTLAGAALGDDEKQRLKDLNERISGLRARFEQALRTDSNDLTVVVDDVAELDGLTPSEISAAAAAATELGAEGSYALTLVLPTAHPYLSSLTHTQTRRRLSEAQRARGSRGNANDTRATVLELARLRAERAWLLGFANHVAAITSDSTAGSAKAVHDLLDRLAIVAARNARKEQAALEERAGSPIEAWDWPFHAQRVRTERYDVDHAAMRPYFEAERVLRDGVFFAAEQLFGLTFTERTDLVGYHPDVRVFEVLEEDDTPVGLYLLDLYTRESKQGGAWMDVLVRQSSLLEMPTAVVLNNLNVPKPTPGEPTLLTFEETEALFHEFGHALHGLLARVTYPKFAGTNVFRDFVEFPSQVNEMWMLWPEVLTHYAVHHETGEPMPTEWVDRLEAARTFNEGYATSEYLAAALLDLAWHELGPGAEIDDVAAFEARALAEAGLDLPAVPPRYSTPYFAHIFAWEYGAAYYSYIWAEVLDADTTEWFAENGGLSRESGERYRRYVLGIGGARDPLESFREFRGRDAEVGPLLRRHGLSDEPASG